MFKRCGAAMLLWPLGMLALGLVMTLLAPWFIAQRPGPNPKPHHRYHAREQRLLEQKNNDASTFPTVNWVGPDSPWWADDPVALSRQWPTRIYKRENGP